VEDLPTLQRATQLTQAEGLKYALEAGRRRKYQNSGTLPWQFDEPFPMASCTSAVDYYAQPKPVYYAAARVYDALHISAKFETIAWDKQDCFEAETWVSSSLAQDIRAASLQARLVGASGRVYARQTQQVDLPANRSARVGSFSADLSRLGEKVFFLDLHLFDPSGLALSENRYIFSRAATLAPLLAVPETQVCLKVEKAGTEWQLELANHGETTALFIWLEDARPLGSPGFVYFQDNYFCLFPAETRTVTARWEGIGPDERKLDISAWNATVR
jgi:beta-mannosidase